MRTTKGISYWMDIFIQLLLILGISANLAYFLFSQDYNFVFGLFLLFFLGVWQLGSAFVKMAFRNYKVFGTYFCLAFAYCISLFFAGYLLGLSNLPSWLETTITRMGLVLIPFAASHIYLYLCLTITTNKT